MSLVRACGSAAPLLEDRPERDVLLQIQAFMLDLDTQLGVSHLSWSRGSCERRVGRAVRRSIACDEQGRGCRAR